MHITKKTMKSNNENRLVSRLVARQAAKNKDLKTVLAYLDSEDTPMADTQELYALMFPNNPTELPLFYTHPAEYLVTYYYEVARLNERWQGATIKQYDREMLSKIVSEAARADDKRFEIAKGGNAWKHWMKVCYMYETNTIDNDYDKVKVEYALMKNPNLNERRSALGVLYINPNNCQICSSVSSSKCSNCKLLICSNVCLTKHKC
jgi:hypothetical protein